MKPHALLLIAILVFITVVSHAQYKGGNLLKNASFVEGIQGWTIKAQPGGAAEVDKDQMRDGKPSVRITNAKPSDTFVTQTVTVKPNTRYRITAYIKTKDVAPARKGGDYGACMAILGDTKTSDSVQNTKAWTKVEWDIESGGLTEIVVGPRLGRASYPVGGTAWFTGLVLAEVGRARK